MSGKIDLLTPDPSEKFKAVEWSKVQFEVLAEERRAFDRYMWQLPVGTLGVVALIVSASEAICGESPQSIGVFIPVLAFSIIICVYAAFLLCRLQARRRLREMRMIEIEDRVRSICLSPTDKKSVVTSGQEVSEVAQMSDRWEIRKFGKIPTTRLGIAILLVEMIILILLMILV